MFILLAATIGPSVGQEPVPARWKGIGDAPDTVLPVASDLSPALQPREIDRALRKVADWQLARAQPYFNQDWTFAALYTGLMAAATVLHEPRYREPLEMLGQRYGWSLGSRQTLADDQAIGQVYLALYVQDRETERLVPTQEQFKKLMLLPDDPQKPVWYWADALFMAPPVWAELTKVTGNPAYLDYMDRQWRITSILLYDHNKHLFFRDATYLNQRDDVGRKIFWSRGNGWVLAGLARVLQAMPRKDPRRPWYVKQFRELAASVLSHQDADGLWRSNLLHHDVSEFPETSGSGFFLYGLAWGVRAGLLERPVYFPALKRGWHGMLTHVYTDGRLGCVQPVGAAPGQFRENASFVYGVGAFLLAGSELHRLTAHEGPVTVKATSR
ncbi:MAG: glycoside hydrolase family 88/105 protein [Janthinobacterium lividum]